MGSRQLYKNPKSALSKKQELSEPVLPLLATYYEWLRKINAALSQLDIEIQNKQLLCKLAPKPSFIPKPRLKKKTLPVRKRRVKYSLKKKRQQTKTHHVTAAPNIHSFFVTSHPRPVPRSRGEPLHKILN